MKKGMQVRKPAVAGSFYPGERESLERELNSLLRKAKKRRLRKLKVLIVPHAGVDYSGLTAAWGYKQIEGENYRRVILLGVSHRNWFGEAVVDESDGWRTPLGVEKVDREVRGRWEKQLGIKVDSRVHEGEHSLELQVIWLQTVLKSYKIIPILISQLRSEVKKSLMEMLVKELVGKETLLVVSSDLSHYPLYEVAKQVDEKTINGIMSGKVGEFKKCVEEVESGGNPGVVTAACGAEAIRVALRVGEKLGIIQWKLLDYRNSGDTGGDRSSVVGYAAIGGYLSKDLSAKAKVVSYEKEAISIARRTLKEFLEIGSISQMKIRSKELKKKRGVFVTLKSKGKLRGCIGELEPRKPAGKLIGEMVVAAACRDPRFYPVKKEELASLKIEISLLSPLRRIKDWKRVKLGKEGVVIGKNGRKGVFLPQVAEETGWDLEEFMEQLCMKAGLPEDAYKGKKGKEEKLWTFGVEKIEEP